MLNINCPLCNYPLRSDYVYNNVLFCKNHNNLKIQFSTTNDIISYVLPLHNYFLISNNLIPSNFMKLYQDYKLIARFDFYNPFPTSMLETERLFDRLIKLNLLA